MSVRETLSWVHSHNTLVVTDKSLLGAKLNHCVAQATRLMALRHDQVVTR